MCSHLFLFGEGDFLKRLIKQAEHDISNRDFAILIVNGEIFTGESHSLALNKFLKNNSEFFRKSNERFENNEIPVSSIHILEHTSAKNIRLSFCIPHKLNNLGTIAYLIGRECRRRSTAGNIILYSPQDSLIIPCTRRYILERTGTGNLRLPRCIPEEGYCLRTGTDTVGAEGGFRCARGNALAYCPNDSVFIVITGSKYL